VLRLVGVGAAAGDSPELECDGRYDLAGWHLIASVRRLQRTLPSKSPRLVDLGTGRGRDIIYLSRCGFRVLGIDLSPAYLEKARRRAARFGIAISLKIGDLRTVRLTGRYDVIFSSCALNNLPTSLRSRRFAHFRRCTRPGGVHAVNAFVRAPSLGPHPESLPDRSPFRSGELRGYYRGWEILLSHRYDFDCLSREKPHRHSVDVVVARKPGRAR
jgi:tellurite methyltransferase